MARKIANNRNTNDTSVTTTVEINDDTTTDLVGANVNRTYLSVQPITGSKAFYVKEQLASADNLKRGHLVDRAKNSSMPYVTEGISVYTGPLSAKADMDTFDVTIIER